jgi:hypothetical protein
MINPNKIDLRSKASFFSQISGCLPTYRRPASLDQLILPKPQYTFLWRLSWLSLLSGIYALYRQHYYLAPAPIGVWLTSINYWRYPDYSWRRYVDIIYVHTALVYQIVKAYNMQNAKEYYMILAIGVAFYPIGVYFHSHKKLWLSTICHSQIHIFGNISNFVLYMGS